jgi:hypothetical protein
MATETFKFGDKATIVFEINGRRIEKTGTVVRSFQPGEKRPGIEWGHCWVPLARAISVTRA